MWKITLVFASVYRGMLSRENVEPLLVVATVSSSSRSLSSVLFAILYSTQVPSSSSSSSPDRLVAEISSSSVTSSSSSASSYAPTTRLVTMLVQRRGKRIQISGSYLGTSMALFDGILCATLHIREHSTCTKSWRGEARLDVDMARGTAQFEAA